MTRAVIPAVQTVQRCVARHDGGWLVLTRAGQSGVSLVELSEGQRVRLESGRVVAA